MRLAEWRTGAERHVVRTYPFHTTYWNPSRPVQTAIMLLLTLLPRLFPNVSGCLCVKITDNVHRLASTQANYLRRLRIAFALASVLLRPSDRVHNFASRKILTVLHQLSSLASVRPALRELSDVKRKLVGCFPLRPDICLPP